jgi:hypothetical protein
MVRKERQPQRGESLTVADRVVEKIMILVSLIFRCLVGTIGMHSRLTRQFKRDNVLALRFGADVAATIPAVRA